MTSRLEKPADELVRDTQEIADDGFDDVDSDVYELRFCEGIGCNEPLPLDRPGHIIQLYGEPCLVCIHCYDAEKPRH